MTPVALAALWFFLAVVVTVMVSSIIHTADDYEREHATEPLQPRNHVEAYLLDPSAAITRQTKEREHDHQTPM